ncbi:metal-sensitive transcriptional regulator [candidate division WWE3 bacterium]|uniref:Metal-sensitive transcriptional regulator n=1 Tax=candidate division WWE3 bacterium TaxID=2053526 RepID=A0A955RS30_UNCKA|nr:metal-sensitive transcriptional regulator [candidate division WWE3 bacterium]
MGGYGSKTTRSQTRSTHRQKNAKERVIHRLKIAKGHIDSIVKMVEDDAYCLDVVHQSRAVQKALQKIDLVLIEDHLSHCVVDQIKSGDETRSKEELLKLFEYK